MTTRMRSRDPADEHFGLYLRRLREARRLSLDAVELLSAKLPTRVTKSHLSRIECGIAMPRLTRLFTLSQIYEVPLSEFASRFEADCRRTFAIRQADEGASPERGRAR